MKSLILFTTLAFGLCAHAENTANTTQAPAGQTTAMPGVKATAADSSVRKPTDSEIIATVKAANDADIDGGKFAEKKASSDEVKDFARDMIKDHTDANKKLKKVMSQNHIRKQENDVSKGEEKMAEHSKAHLKSVKGKDFDTEYMLSEQTMHQQVLDSLDNDLIPNAQDESLKAYLKEIRPTIAEHLQKAKTIYTNLTTAKK